MLRTILKTRSPWSHRKSSDDDTTATFDAHNTAGRDTIALLPRSQKDAVPTASRAAFSVSVGRAQLELAGAIAQNGPDLAFGKNCELYSLARRRAPRITFEHSIAFQTSAGEHHAASILDIGPGGLCLRTDALVTEGQELRIFGVPGLEPPTSTAVVRWRRATGRSVIAGLEFVYRLRGRALDAVLQAYFPRLHSRSAFSEAQIHQLFSDSEYLALDDALRLNSAWLRLDDDHLG
ncbi:MAG: PilZ domain-containing protein, partial [Myxococcota bacterium]